MCGRYRRRSEKQEIAEHFRALSDAALEFAPDPDIRPTTMQPIIRQNRDTGERELVTARWGFVPTWQKPGEKFPPTTFNARAEGIATAGMWKRAFERHRCLVPADAFYELKKIRPKNNPKIRDRSDG